MAAFTDAELKYLALQRLARLATASATGEPDVSAVGFAIDGDTMVSGGMDITKTVRYRHPRENPLATVVIDDLRSLEPWQPPGVKVRGTASIESDNGTARIRIRPTVIWSWGINEGAEKRFASIEKRTVG